MSNKYKLRTSFTLRPKVILLGMLNLYPNLFVGMFPRRHNHQGKYDTRKEVHHLEQVNVGEAVKVRQTNGTRPAKAPHPKSLREAEEPEKGKESGHPCLYRHDALNDRVLNHSQDFNKHNC